MRKRHLRFVYGVVAVFIFGFVSCPVMGQVTTKIPLTEKDYHLWGTLQTRAISDNGKWVSYNMAYESNADTLFVTNTKTEKKYAFPKGWDSKFIQDNIFAYRTNECLKLLDLTNGLESTITNVLNYDISGNGKNIITEEKEADESKRLCIRNIQGLLLQSINDIEHYVWNNTKSKILYNTGGFHPSVKIIDLRAKPIITSVYQKSNVVYGSLSWQNNGENVVFYETNKEDKVSEVIYYISKENKYYNLNSESIGFPKDFRIDIQDNISLKIADDGSKVFFGIQSKLEASNKENFEGVEIWNANDKLLYPERKLKASVGNPQLLAVWWPKTGIIKTITSEEESWVMLTGNQEFAITANPLQYEPEYKLFADRDYFLTDLATGNRIMLLEKQSGQGEMIRVSPDGNYIIYFSQGNWWSYNLAQKAHTNITEGLSADWDNLKTDPGTQQNVWGIAGFTTDNKSMLVYDYYDIWQIDLSGMKRERFTKGKESQTRFRIKSKQKVSGNYCGFTDVLVNTKDMLLLSALNLYDGSNGFYQWNPNKTVTQLVMKQEAINKLLVAKDNQAFVFETQKFDVPPTLVLKENYHTDEKILYRSNAHHERYLWGKSKMIHFKVPSGKELNGALFYPADYNLGTKYPIIVWIYDIVSRDIDQYVNPTLKNTLGYNITNLTSNGYFVLLPDIKFEKGNPGKSALDCVTAAVKKVIEMGYTEQGQIGLMGQSFGAYETNYIISQTNLFSGAVSGSGVSDIVRHYFTVNSNDNMIDAWRYENQQYRMGKSFFDDKQGYFNNSPLMQANSIHTPLLTWAGLQDENVRPEQALTLYIALRRLNKKHIMLRYLKDGHIFFNEQNQIDLTNRIQQWFDHFLKKEPAPEWIANGTK